MSSSARRDRVGADRELVEAHPVEALGVVAHRVVAPVTHVGEDLAHGRADVVPLPEGAGEPGAQVAGNAADVDTDEHGNASSYRRALVPLADFDTA